MSKHLIDKNSLALVEGPEKTEFDALSARVDSIVASQTSDASGFKIESEIAIETIEGTDTSASHTFLIPSNSEILEASFAIGGSSWIFDNLSVYSVETTSGVSVTLTAEFEATGLVVDVQLKLVYSYPESDTITELTDIRIGADGSVYGSAGAAVRAQAVQIDETLTQSGKAADAKATGDELNDLKSALGTLIPIDLAKGTTFTSGKYVNYASGDLTNSGSAKATDYIDITGISKIVYTKRFTTSSSSYQGIAFYDSGKTYIADSGIRIILNASEDHLELSTATVPEGAKYIRMTAWDFLGDIHLYDEAEYKTKVYQQIDAIKSELATDEAEIARIDSFQNEILKDGYFNLPLDKWALNGWTSYNSTDSRTYRVHYIDPITFDRDVYILADFGYVVVAIASNGTDLGAGTILKIPANTTFKINSRRFTENTSEVISDITPFAKAIHFSTALAAIELNQPTFTDVSMFERMGISGDSYAAGGGIISGKTALTWGKNLQRQAGIQVDIYAKSGDSIVDWVVNQTKGLPALLAGEECGLYWFQHGINGTSSAAAIGTMADMSANPKPQTFYGQYVYAIQAVQAAFPKARIVVATVMGSNFGIGQTAHMQAANTAIRKIAEYCEVPLIEIAEDDYFKSQAYGDLTSSSHPTAMVSAGMAMAYRRLLSKCMLKNSLYFLYYGSDL